MPEYRWPEIGTTSLIGKRINRVDGPEKVTGRAKYTYDLKRPGMLYGKMLRCPHAHARILSIDTSEAEKLSGVAAVHIVQEPGTEIQWAGDDVVAVAAVTEQITEDAIRRIKVEYEKLPHLVREEDLAKAGDRVKPFTEQVTGDPDQAFQAADTVVVEGEYGLPVVTHCCLEVHGQVAEWEGDRVTIYPSIQGVERVAGQYAQALGVPASNVRTLMQYVGGGFGSKVAADRWGTACAQLAKKAGKPVRLMLERKEDQEVAGNRPSDFARIKLAATRDGTITAWQSESWGTGGPGGGGSPPIPYIWQIPNQRKIHSAIATNCGPARAWRAPNHPQACYLTMCPIDDLAAKLNMDPLDLVVKNVSLLGPRAELYRQELAKAAELMEWKKNWHPRGDRSPGPMKRGMGLSLHTWGGGGHSSECQVSIHPDGSVEVSLCTQDIGTGTRTVLTIVTAETLGLPVEAIRLNIGDNRLPPSGNSGGSTTVGGVSSSTRRAALNALEQLFLTVAPSLGVSPEQLEAVGGQIRVKGDPTKSLSWKQATAKLGVASIKEMGKQPGPQPNPGELTSSGVGGVQMADVSVDVETGVVKVNKIVAVQDCGLIIDMKTAESQVYGALIMGICYSLMEERVMDQLTGRMLNANMEFYKLAGLADIGELVVHMWTDPEQQRRGVIGLGEPPVISPGAVIANAVASAIGVRVPYLPLTPPRVLAALEKGGMV
ncbi:MAG: xanthine dehydrogenase family protein molybdopterin-binding subunit [Acidobacteria bacterium]|nr:xanthine dehydrogenase family protein molybdopterin-binding subunit [Acidobacteriota bacterium]